MNSSTCVPVYSTLVYMRVFLHMRVCVSAWIWQEFEIGLHELMMYSKTVCVEPIKWNWWWLLQDRAPLEWTVTAKRPQSTAQGGVSSGRGPGRRAALREGRSGEGRGGGVWGREVGGTGGCRAMGGGGGDRGRAEVCVCGGGGGGDGLVRGREVWGFAWASAIMLVNAQS